MNAAAIQPNKKLSLMTYKQLRYQVDCAVNSGNPARALEDIKQNIYKTQLSDCDRSRTIWITSADTGTRYPIQVCCGECYHCVETKQNEWVTRMWHETKYNSRFCYFITLTYKPQYRFEDIPDRLMDAFWHFDDYNEFHRHCWSPCLCKLEHLQYFFRNLRNDLQASGRNRELTYYACAELGKEFGRPHFHMILWTQDPITSYDVTKAWSIRKGKKFMSSDPIGRIEVDDLNNNGTICKHDIKIDGIPYSPSRAFAYVAKYVGKNDKYNKTRLMFFVKAMQKRFDLGFFSDRVLKHYIPNYIQYVSQHYQDPLFRYDIEKCVKVLLYPRRSDLPSQTEEFGYSDFLFPFGPFRTCSRAQGIGSVYVKTNIDILANGCLRLHDEELGNLVFPAFYMRKIKDYKCGFEFRSRTSLSSSYSKGCRPIILSDFRSLCENDPFDLGRENIRKTYCVPIENFDLQGESLNKWLNSSFVIRDPYNGYRCLLYTRYNGLSEYLYVGFWKYSRQKSSYVKLQEMPFSLFYDNFEMRITKAAEESIVQQKKAFEQLADRLYVKDTIDNWLKKNNQNCNYEDLVFSVQNVQNEERVQMAKKNYDNFNRKDL